jgi:hypothetical protein
MTETATPLTDTDRASKVAKITALLAKTEANGCTPDEAAAAAKMANTLMTRYSIAPSECRPETRRRPSVTTLDDLLNNFWTPSPEDQAATTARRVAQAQYQYRRNGVHIGEGYHADCMCANCKADPARATAPRPRRRRSTSTAGSYSANGTPGGSCDCSSCRAARGEQPAGPSANGFYGNNSGPKRSQTSHKNCTHENTKAARARCRRDSA